MNFDTWHLHQMWFIIWVMWTGVSTVTTLRSWLGGVAGGIKGMMNRE